MANYKILSLDGGGARGYITTLWLQELEKRLGKPLYEVFDLIVGTSTGSIIASGISSGLSANEIVELYENFTDKIFEQGPMRWWDKLKRTFTQGIDSPKYSGDNLEKVFRIAYGSLKFGKLGVDTLITSYDLRDSKPLIFKSFDPRFKKIPVWEIVKASSSAPIYFPAHILRFDNEVLPLIDGGVVANNPSMVGIVEGYRILSEQNNTTPFKDIVLASFGTGEKRESISAEKADKLGLIGWIKPISDILFDGAMDSVDYMAKNFLGENHYRFQTELKYGSENLDNGTPENLDDLAKDAREYLTNSGSEKMDRLIKSLS